MATRIDRDPMALLASRQRQKRAGNKQFGLTPKVRRAVDLIVFGPDDGSPAPATLAAAAQVVGLAARSLQRALEKDSVLAFYRGRMKLLREGHRPANIRALAEIRDDPSLKASAAGARARVAAVAQLEVDPDARNGISANVVVNVTTERAGYVIDLSAHPAEPLTIEHDPTGERDRVTLDDDDQYERAALPLRAPAGASDEGWGEKSADHSQFVSPPRESPLAETPTEYFSPSDENLVRRAKLRHGDLGTLAPGSRPVPRPPEPPHSRRHGPDASHGVGRRRGGN